MGYEAVARPHGHWISFEALGQDGGPGTGVTSGAIVANARVWRQLHLEAAGRVQQGPDYSDASDSLGKLEAPPGFEPGVEVLQTSALPLGDGAP
jgi:hypothetical protein